MCRMWWYMDSSGYCRPWITQAGQDSAPVTTRPRHGSHFIRVWENGNTISHVKVLSLHSSRRRHHNELKHHVYHSGDDSMYIDMYITWHSESWHTPFLESVVYVHIIHGEFMDRLIQSQINAIYAVSVLSSLHQ